MKKIFIYVIIVLFIFSTINAEIESYEPVQDKILLKSRQVIPELGISENAKNIIAAKDGAHVLIQFYNNPSEKEKKELEKQGIFLLSYIPNKAWFAFIQGNANNPNVRSITEILPQDKISPAIKHKGNKMNLSVILFNDDFSFLDKYGNIIEVYGNIVKLEINSAVINAIAKEDNVQWIDVSDKTLQRHNDGNRENTGVDILQNSPYSLSGTGIVTSQWDGGWADTTHDDFLGRVTIGDAGCSEPDCSTDTHATHVAGTMLGNGTLSNSSGGTSLQWKGMAPLATLIGYEWWNSLTELNNEYNASINTYNASLSQNSWGYEYLSCGNDCSGGYDSFTAELDGIVRGSKGKKITQVWSAGNNRPSNCDSGSFDCIGIPGTAKNAITVGATNSDDDSITYFTSYGPTNDGRLKPEVTAPGCEGDKNDGTITGSVWSTVPTDTYAGMCGTSMAAPTTSGVVALMYEQYSNKGIYPLPSTIKAILIHTAKDLGNTGPDYSFGYGRINALAAINKIDEDAGITDVIKEGTISNSEVIEFDMTVDSSVKVTLVWDDYPATANAATTLVNDLDLVLIAPDNSQYFPWVLDPNDPSNAATTGTNTIDNTEQVFIENPQHGVWTVQVKGTSVPNGPQNFSLVSDHSFSILPSTEVKTFRDSSYSEEDMFFNNGQIVYIQANVTAAGEPLENFTVDADIIFNDVVQQTISLNEISTGIYRNSWTSSGSSGVYTINITATNFTVSKANSDFHLYPGSGVSAYLLDFDKDDDDDYVLENLHLISVFDGKNNTDQSLLYLGQKDTNVSYDFAAISDSDTVGRGEITTTNLKGLQFSSLSFSQTGESLSSANLQINTEVSDPTEALITFYDSTNGASSDSNFFVDNGQWLAQQFDSTDLDQDYTLTKVSVFVDKGPRASNPLIVEIRTDSGGSPSNTLLTSESIPSSSISTTASWLDVSFTSTITLEQGGLYWLVLRNIDSKGGGPNFVYTWTGDNTAPTYAGAFAFSQDQGSTWNSDNVDQLFRAWGFPAAITTIFDVSISMNSEDVDYLVYNLNNFDSNIANMNDLFAAISGSFDYDGDDRYHLQTGEDDLITSLTPNQWNNFNSNYTAIYDNSNSDSVNDNVIAFVRLNESTNVKFQDVGLWQGSEGLRIRYNVTQTTASDEISYLLAFTTGDWQIIDQWMPSIHNNQLPFPNFMTSPSGELISITLIGFPVDFSNLDPTTVNSSATGNSNDSYVISVDLITTVNVDIYTKGNNFTNGGNILAVQNVIYDDDNVLEGLSDSTNPEIILINTYGVSPYFVNIPPNTSKNIYYWISIPSAQRAGDYSTTFYIKAVETGT